MSLSFEWGRPNPIQAGDTDLRYGRHDDWLLERKVKLPVTKDLNDLDEWSMGNNYCFGVRTVAIGVDGVWH